MPLLYRLFSTLTSTSRGLTLIRSTAILPALRTPKRRSDVETRTVGDEVVVLDATGQRVHRLNGSASYIWDCCDGRNSVSEIVARLAAAFGVTQDAVLSDVHNAIAEFDRLGLMEDSVTG
jgi:hypothetical protein